MLKQVPLMRVVFICIFAFFNDPAFSQNIDLPIDSIKTILCKKWEVYYALVGNVKMGRLPSATDMKYQFLQNGSLIMTSDDTTEKTKGIWSYDAKKKNIFIIVGSRTTGEITALKEEEFIMKVKLDKSSPKEVGVTLVYKPKTNTSAPLVKKTNKPSSVHIKNLGLSDPTLTTVYVGKENLLEIEGVKDNLSFSVIGGGTTMRKADQTKVILLPSKEGTVFFTVTRNGKVIATKQFSAILSSK